MLANLLAGASLVALAAGGPAYGQAASQQSKEPAIVDGGTAIEEVVVTAQRRSEDLLDVPLAVTALTEDRLNNAGVTNSVQLAAVVPNLQINSAFGDAQPNFTLRGIGVANEFNANQASPIGIYVDDAYLAARTLHGMQLYDLERVEVLRGPQGTLYGRNTTGGAINFITRMPQLEGAGGYISVGAGNFGLVETNAAGEVTLVPDRFGMRVAVNYAKHDGYFNNLTAGQPDAQSQDDLSGRISFRIRPTDSLDIKIKVYDGRSGGVQNGVHPIGTAPDGSNPISGYKRSGDLDFFDVEMNDTGETKIKAHGALLDVAWAASDNLSFTSLTSYDKGDYHTAADVDGSPYSVVFNTYNAGTKQLNQELRANLSAGSLNLTAGLYYGWDEVDTKNLFMILGGYPASAFGIGQEYLQRRRSEAVFAQGDYNFDQHWALSAGLRYTKDKIEYEHGRAYLTDIDGVPTVSTLPVSGPFDPNAELATLKHDGDAFTGRIALSYHTDSGHLLYASYSRGYRAGVFNGNATDLTALTYVRPESVDAYEIGVKGRFIDDRLMLTAAAFHYNYVDQQIQDVVAPFSFLRNAPRSTLNGLELEATARLTSDLTLEGAIGWLDAKYDELTLSGINIDGNELPFAPHFTGSAGFNWLAGNVGGGDVTFAGNVDYSTRVWFSPFNAVNGNQNLQEGPSARVNASVSWRRDKVTAELWAKNLFEEEYYTYGLDIRSLGIDYLVPAPPRTFGVRLRYDL
jgi:iron complex outermembrane receptor protein